MDEDGREGDAGVGITRTAKAEAVALSAGVLPASPPLLLQHGGIAHPALQLRGLGMTLLAGAFALGIVIVWKPATPVLWPWLWAACAAVIAAAVLRSLQHQRPALVALLLAMVCAGAAWVTLKHEYVAPNDLAALIGDESVLVRLEGVATRSPELRSRTSGSMARFDYRPAATYFPMRVDHLLARDGTSTPVEGAVLVRVDETVPPFRAGDHVQVTGFLLRPAMPRNPGEFDYRQYAKSLGQAGILTVSGRDLVQVRPAERSAIASRFLEWRDILRHRASAWLLANLPEGDRSKRDALLASLLLGERDAEIDRVYESFQRVGLAHILAISGFHLAVLAAFVLFVARLTGGARRWHGWIVIGAVLLYLFLVEARTPVLRSGVMTIAGCIGMVFGRRLRVSGLVSLSAIMLLLWRPDELFNPGFQLTYGVVLALLHLAPGVRRRWFGHPKHDSATSAQMLGEWLRSALAASVTAWLVATPIAAYHFGSIAVVGIPLSLIAVPLSALILALGYVKIVLSALLPSAAMLLGVPLTISADVLLAIVGAVDDIPFSSVHVPPPSTWWALAAIAWVCWWSLSRRHESRPRARIKWACLFALSIWLTWPLLPLPQIPPLRDRDPLLRMDMLAVGDGSCYVLRSGGKTMVFDAGSSSDLSAGRRSLVPAMRRLGVRHVDLIVVTHANLDHYSAVIEIASEFDVEEILLTPQFLAAADADALSPMAYMLSQLTARHVGITEIMAASRWSVGECHIECLHPPQEETFARVNDASMVLRITAGDRRALLCGDIQAQAMVALMQPQFDLRSDILELPHHGSHNEVAEAFVDRVRPGIVMQSTGWTRWQRDRWAPKLANAERLVTVRDGACTVIVEHDGSMRVERFLPAGVVAGGAEIE